MEPILSFVFELFLSFLFWVVLLPVVCVFVTPPILVAGMFGHEATEKTFGRVSAASGVSGASGAPFSRPGELRPPRQCCRRRVLLRQMLSIKTPKRGKAWAVSWPGYSEKAGGSVDSFCRHSPVGGPGEMVRHSLPGRTERMASQLPRPIWPSVHSRGPLRARRTGLFADRFPEP